MSKFKPYHAPIKTISFLSFNLLIQPVRAADPLIEPEKKPEEKAPIVAAAPVKILYVAENQPIQIVDQAGRLLQVVYLRKTPLVPHSANSSSNATSHVHGK